MVRIPATLWIVVVVLAALLLGLLGGVGGYLLGRRSTMSMSLSRPG